MGSQWGQTGFLGDRGDRLNLGWQWGQAGFWVTEVTGCFGMALGTGWIWDGFGDRLDFGLLWGQADFRVTEVTGCFWVEVVTIRFWGHPQPCHQFIQGPGMALGQEYGIGNSLEWLCPPWGRVTEQVGTLSSPRWHCHTRVAFDPVCSARRVPSSGHPLAPCQPQFPIFCGCLCPGCPRVTHLCPQQLQRG